MHSAAGATAASPPAPAASAPAASARGLRCTGVRYLQCGSPGEGANGDCGQPRPLPPSSAAIVHARHEVVLCAGVVGSPQLLLLSGIGPAEAFGDGAARVVSGGEHPIEAADDAEWPWPACVPSMQQTLYS